MRQLKTVAFYVFYTPLVIFCLLFYLIATVVYAPYVLIRNWIVYKGAPEGCCKSDCELCPWGNPKLRKFRVQKKGRDAFWVTPQEYEEGRK